MTRYETQLSPIYAVALLLFGWLAGVGGRASVAQTVVDPGGDLVAVGGSSSLVGIAVAAPRTGQAGIRAPYEVEVLTRSGERVFRKGLRDAPAFVHPVEGSSQRDRAVIVGFPEQVEALSEVDGSLVAFDMESGAERWRAEANASSYLSSPDGLYVITAEANHLAGERAFVAVDVRTGEVTTKLEGVGFFVSDWLSDTVALIAVERAPRREERRSGDRFGPGVQEAFESLKALDRQAARLRHQHSRGDISASEYARLREAIRTERQQLQESFRDRSTNDAFASRQRFLRPESAELISIDVTTGRVLHRESISGIGDQLAYVSAARTMSSRIVVVEDGFYLINGFISPEWIYSDQQAISRYSSALERLWTTTTEATPVLLETEVSGIQPAMRSGDRYEKIEASSGATAGASTDAVQILTPLTEQARSAGVQLRGTSLQLD